MACVHLNLPSWQVFPCARRSTRRQLGAPESKAKARHQRRFAVAFDFGAPCVAPSSAASAVGEPKRTFGSGIHRPWMACVCRPRAREQRRHPSSHSDGGCGTRGLFSLAYFSLHKQREWKRPTGELSRRPAGRKTSSQSKSEMPDQQLKPPLSLTLSHKASGDRRCTDMRSQ